MNVGDILIRNVKNSTYKEILLVINKSRIKGEVGFDCVVVYSQHQIQGQSRWFGEMFTKAESFNNNWKLISNQ